MTAYPHIAFVFAGQGAQAPGMGEALANAYPAARAVFRGVDSVRPGTSDICFRGTQGTLAFDDLDRTINTQPCMFATDLAAAEALREEGVEPAAVAGFSVGELPALAFAGALSVEDAFRLICIRAEAMEACAEETPGSMAAILRMDNADVEAICEETGTYAVNYNCPGQLVIAGDAFAMEAALALVVERGGRPIMLRVSGAFHTPYMQAAADAQRAAVANLHFSEPRIAIYSNVTARPYGPNDFKTLIPRQTISPVRWEETVRDMVSHGIDTFIEVGPGKVLSGLIRKIAPQATTCAVSDPATLAAALAKIEEGTTR